MAMVLEKVVPFGRSMDEYIKIFSLTNADLNKKIIRIGDGSASFNAEMTRQGKSVVFVDPLYQFSGDEILQRFNEVVDNIINQPLVEKSWTHTTSLRDATRSLSSAGVRGSKLRIASRREGHKERKK